MVNLVHVEQLLGSWQVRSDGQKIIPSSPLVSGRSLYCAAAQVEGFGGTLGGLILATQTAPSATFTGTEEDVPERIRIV